MSRSGDRSGAQAAPCARLNRQVIKIIIAGCSLSSFRTRHRLRPSNDCPEAEHKRLARKVDSTLAIDFNRSTADEGGREALRRPLGRLS
jgi:hypothetical protein